MLGLLLLLQVLASCLCLGHSEVVKTFKNACDQFFYEKTPPGDSLRPTNAARICQRSTNKYHFATLYDKTRRIPVYSAYIYKPGPGDRFDSWFVEPQLIDKSYHRYMETEQSIKDTHKISSQKIGENQAIDQDYMDAQGLDRGHLSPSGHQSDNDKLATFTLTNIVPQYTTLNQRAWKEYEDKTMPKKTQGCDKTYVITGAVPGDNTISNGRVNVPSHIWSAACCLKNKKPIKAWGVIAENKRNENKVTNFNLGELEKKLAKLYRKPEVTLFKGSCSQQQASHP